MKTYTKREMAHIFNVSPRTIEDDVKFLGIEPQLGDRNMNLYDQNDFNLIEQMRAHLENKLNTRE
ncbi:MAG: MerR family transcriptional regulator [Pleurocapsa sp. SU_5_0]|nr:MerR family transcriptional regulator [Pleurocapsa sp. SU_5_0]NJO98235.1 MerR family transcriptional regulator [Pleurocapsa sp. CRU_1_2]NJR48017.1 MerR family transcriptional regulator [Hyellaceae cyanobacterium CSU_1_1]